jgi:mRNA-degrading endonuclease RelE of RelBE toxin-antitoxin system
MSKHFLIFVPNSVKKSLAKIPLPWIFRMGKTIDSLETNPYIGEKMGGYLKDKRKIHVWPYRIIYTVNEKKRIVIIQEVAHRGNVSYK